MTPTGEAGGELLVIVTGGTIGMTPGPLGLEPLDGRVEGAIGQLRPASASIRVVRFDPLIDSAHIEYAHWNAIIDQVVSWQGAGVVVTHGTDTMAFTGAALAFALAGL
ncbi:MAG: asparaginase, partial [Rhizobiales bacterium]|nr:asparaginase [Hyphomicrobiales bacterium]